MDRRTFLKSLGLAAAGVVLAPANMIFGSTMPMKEADLITGQYGEFVVKWFERAFELVLKPKHIYMQKVEVLRHPDTWNPVLRGLFLPAWDKLKYFHVELDVDRFCTDLTFRRAVTTDICHQVLLTCGHLTRRNILDHMVEVGKKLDMMDVPRKNRWVRLPKFMRGGNYGSA